MPRTSTRFATSPRSSTFHTLTRAALYGFLLAAAADLVAVAVHASPVDRTFRLDIPAGPAGPALAELARTTAIAIGWGRLPQNLRARAVRGTMSVEEALRRLLEGSGYEARRAGDTAWRIVPARRVLPKPPAPARRPPLTPTQPVDVGGRDIVITGQKRSQRLSDVAASVSVVHPDEEQRGHLAPGSRDVANSLEGLAITNLGPGRNRSFIRGVADSPFNGVSQSTVAVVLDEARVTFDAPDPDLRLIDVEQVEVLKGPQGPLYGSGALGGIFHVVTRKPSLVDTEATLRSAATATEHGALGAGADAVLNLPIVTDKLAVRAVGYRVREGGWIDDLGGRQNANATNVGGARLAVRWQPSPDWTIDASGMLQDVNSHDSQYVTASDDTLVRESRFREPTDNDFKSAALTVHGELAGLDLLAASSYVAHALDTRLDASDAAGSFGESGPTLFVDDRKYTLRNHEVRVSPRGSGRWLLGASYLAASTDTVGTLETGNRRRIVETASRRVSEAAVFTEFTAPLTGRLGAVVGARLSRTAADDETTERESGLARRTRKKIFSPSVALTWQAAGNGIAYARYARAVRPGGLAPSNEAGAREFDADELGTLDVGYRWRSRTGRLAASISVFGTSWSDIQSDYLLDNGLVSTRNAGKGAVYGTEATAEWKSPDGTSVSLGAAYVDARLTRTASGVEVDDRRLPVTPDLTARIVARQRFTLAGMPTVAFAQGNYVGRARLAFDPDLDRRMGGYALVSSGILLSPGKLTFGVRLDNLFDIKGDSFAFGNPFSIRAGRQYTPLRPRTLSLSVERTW